MQFSLEVLTLLIAVQQNVKLCRCMC